MVRRSSFIFAASLAVLSALEPTLGFAAAAPAQHHDEVEKPRFLRREIKRQFPNTTTFGNPQGFRGPFGGQSSTDLDSLAESLTSTLVREPVVTPETTTLPPTQTPPLEVELQRQIQISQSQLSQSLQEALRSSEQSSAPPTTATLSTTSTSAIAQETKPTTSAAPITSPVVSSSVNIPETQPSTTALPSTTPSINTNTNEPATQSTSTPALSSPPSSTNGPETQPSITTGSVTSPPVSSNSNGPETQPITTPPATSLSVNTDTPALPTQSTPTLALSNSLSSTNGPETKPTTNPVGVSSPPSDTNSNGPESKPTTTAVPSAPSMSSGANSQPTTAATNSESSLPIVIGGTKSSVPVVNDLSTSQTPPSQTPDSSSTEQSDSGFATTSKLIQQSAPNKAGPTTNDVQATSQILPSTSVSIHANSGSNVGEQGLPTTSATLPATSPSNGQQSPPNPTSETNPDTQTKPTTGVTARIPTYTPEGSIGSPGQPSSTQPSLGEQIPSSATPSTPVQNTKSGATESGQFSVPSETKPANSQSGPAVVSSLPNGGQQSLTSGVEQQTFPVSNTPGITPITRAQEQSTPPSNPSVVNTNQQPFTQPGQSQISQQSAGATHATSLPEGTEQSLISNTVIPSTSGGALPIFVENSKSSPVPAGGNTSPSVQTDASVAGIPTSGTEAPPVTQTSGAGIIPTFGPSEVPSVGASFSGANSNGAQPASSPSLPESAVVSPTATGGNPPVTTGSGETGQSATAVRQGTSEGTSALQASQSGAANPSDTGKPEDSTPTGSQLYSALTNALQATVGPGSTMLPNGAIIPTSQLVEGGKTATPQTAQPSGGQEQESGTAVIVPAPSITLSPSSVVPNPLASSPLAEQTQAASITLSNGNVVPNPLSSNSPASQSGVQQSGTLPVTLPSSGETSLPEASGASLITLSDGRVIPNPSASIAPVTTALPVIPASLTLSDGSVVQNPLATSLPSEISPGILGQSTFGAANSIQNSGVLPTALTTDSNGVILPIPVPSTAVNTAAVSTGLPETNYPITTVAPVSGSPASNLPQNSGTPATGVVSQSEGLVSGTAASQASGPIPSSSTLPVVVASATNSNGETVPITAGQVTGSSTLSDGAIVPLTASNPTASLAPGASVTSAGTPSLQTLSGGSIVSAASGNSPPTSQTGVAQTAASQNTAGSAASTGGAGTTVSPQSDSLPAPAPVTGTATGLPNTSGSPPAQIIGATTQPSFPSDGKGPFTQLPTGYDTQTAQSVPTSILAQPSSTFASQSSYSGPTGLPSGVPLVLYPPSGQVKKPDNTDLIQIGFLYPLNYDFVWTNPESQAQIFKYLPMGIAWGLQIDIENVTMQSLRALDTTQDLHYITTLALAWVPSGQVDSLGLLVHTSTSRLYHTPDNSTNTLLSMINIALPIAADNSTDGGDSTSFGAAPSSTSTVKDGGAPVGGSIGNSNPVRGSSVGIAAGVACGAAAYGAAMFFVARRYRKRRQSHLRSPSMFSSPVMSHVGPDAGAGAALMSGGVGDHRSPSPYHDEDARAASRGSGRSASTGRQPISAPVMAENSLGWN